MTMEYYDDYNNRHKFVSHLVKFDKDQLYEINMGVLTGLSTDQITMYARPEFNYMIMRMIKESFYEHMDMDKIELMASGKFTYPQLIAIKSGFKNGLTLDQVKSYANPELSINQMLDEMNRIMKDNSQ